jgi:hypothetical protein
LQTLSVEFSHAGDTGTSMDEMWTYMLDKGYSVNR